MRDFRFGVNVGDGEELLDFARLVERQGFDVLLASDHLGGPAPFAQLAAAAAVTERIRLGTYVINVPFWNSWLLAREFATVDRISGGRVEVGLGSGHMKSEFDAAGIPWTGFDARADRLATAIDELDRLFGDDGQAPMPVQRPRPPLLIGGTSDRLLRLAAEHADIVAFGGVFQVKGAEPGRFRLATAAELDERVAFYGSLAGERADRQERGLLVQWVQVSDDRHAAAERVRSEYGLELPVEELLESPVLLLGSVDQIVERVHSIRDRYGVTYLVGHRRSFDSWSRVVRAMKPG